MASRDDFLRLALPLAAQHSDVLHDRKASSAEQRLHHILVHASRRAKNARPDVQTRQGATALSIASRRGYAEVVRALLAKKADPNKADFTGRTPLAYAREARKPAIEAMLRKAGAKE